PLVEVPSGDKAVVLYRFDRIENAFLSLKVSGGKGAVVKLEYAESMINNQDEKGRRDVFFGNRMLGVYDEFVLDGKNRSYTSLWFRTGYYIKCTIDNSGPETMYLEDLSAQSFAYPFEEKGSFTTPDTTLRTDAIWDVAWQTARLCAQETYVDCPYYEQLQYVGDTRIQALISLYVTGDDRLMRKAIRLFEQSRTSQGLTQSRYPSLVPQVIPPYSLSWIEMVGDYWMHRPDTAFVREMLPGVRSVLEWYNNQLLDNGLVGPTQHWNFVDWTDQWVWDNELRIGGVPDMAGGSSIISLQYLSALRRAEEMYGYFGDKHQANIYKDRADRIASAVSKHCWQEDRLLFSDTPAATSFSQHANILALLTDIAPADPPDDLLIYQHDVWASFREVLLQNILTDTSLIQVSEYFRFYLIQAMYQLGRGDLYPQQLNIWAAYLDQGFTTFPERPGKTRSDCHAWSASPNYDLLATLAGIRPGSPGFQTVDIRPASVDFPYTATAAHPAGTITVKCTPKHHDLHFKVTLPTGITGHFALEGQTFSLEPGLNKLSIGLE
ncbi:MAG: alpha-L-rhamnosidase, partial [Bacteroidota bacterium]